jgi:hypothetical protein
MSSNGGSSRFSFFDLPSALWYFLGPERWRFLVFSGILLIVLCYTMVPPYIIGLTTNFLIGYVKADSANRPSISPLFWFADCSMLGFFCSYDGSIAPRFWQEMANARSTMPLQLANRQDWRHLVVCESAPIKTREKSASSLTRFSASLFYHRYLVKGHSGTDVVVRAMPS